MRILYETRDFKPRTLATIAHANEIIDEYAAKGYQLTLRQLYYQFVSRALIANTPAEYNKLGCVINDGRLAGMIDWDAIVDLTRELTKNSHWDSPRDIVSACEKQYQIDKWETQPNYVEVWIEKDALSGIFEPLCRQLDVPFFSCRGYTSQSAMWEAGQRLNEHADQDITILHFGDHDPSGIDMTRDITDRLNMFADRVTSLTIERIALTHAQVRRYRPPPNPAKVTDSRAKGYIRIHGRESWELDALEPDVLGALVREEVLARRDETRWAQALKRENVHKAAIGKVVSMLPEA